MGKQNRQKRKWYPLNFVGWCVLILYTALLSYTVIMSALHENEPVEALFQTAVLINWLVLVAMLWAKKTGEEPFKNETKQKSK